MNRLLFIPLITALMTVIPSGASAGHATHHCRSSCVRCPRCQGCCSLKVSEEKEKKNYWTVETEQICVPNIVFPWQNPGLHRRGAGGCAGGCSAGGCAADGCSGGCGAGGCGSGCRGAGGCGAKCGRVAHNGARVITVCKLKKNSYECPTCKYEWSVAGGGSGCSTAADDKDKSSKKEESPESESPAEEITPPETPAASPEPPVEAPTPAAAQAAVKPVVKPRAVRPQSRPAAHQDAIARRLLPEAEAPPEPTFSITDPFSRPSVFDSYGRVAGQP